jgi:hypothetical protein
MLTLSYFNGRLTGGLGAAGEGLWQGMAGITPAVPIRCPHGDADGVPGWPRGRAG